MCNASFIDNKSRASIAYNSIFKFDCFVSITVASSGYSSIILLLRMHSPQFFVCLFSAQNSNLTTGEKKNGIFCALTSNDFVYRYAGQLFYCCNFSNASNVCLYEDFRSTKETTKQKKKNKTIIRNKHRIRKRRIRAAALKKQIQIQMNYYCFRNHDWKHLALWKLPEKRTEHFIINSQLDCVNNDHHHEHIMLMSPDMGYKMRTRQKSCHVRPVKCCRKNKIY